MVKCLTNFCQARSQRGSDYCMRCNRLLNVSDVPDNPTPKLFEYSVLCIVCSTRTSIKTTEKIYQTLRAWPYGSKCGRCGSAGLEWSVVDMGNIGSPMSGVHGTHRPSRV